MLHKVRLVTQSETQQVRPIFSSNELWGNCKNVQVTSGGFANAREMGLGENSLRCSA